MIRIVNLRSYKLMSNEVLVRVDRSSILGNPFHMTDESRRDEVCDKYQVHFNKQVAVNPQFLSELVRIAGIADDKKVALGCWCYPKRCHAETILNWVEKFNVIPF